MKTIDRYNGQGQIRNDSISLSCSFTISQMNNGRLIGESIIEDDFQAQKLFDQSNARISGRTTDGYILVEEPIYITKFTEHNRISFVLNSLKILNESVSLTPKFVKYGLTNFIFDGIDWTSMPNGEQRRDKFTLSLGGKNILVKQVNNYKEVSKIIKNEKGIDVTSEIIISCEDKQELEEFSHLVTDISTLLSFARGTRIRWIYYTLLTGNNILIEERRIHSNTRPLYNGFEVISDNTPWEPDIKTFLESCYSYYQKFKTTLKLFVPIEYYLESKSHEIQSIKFLLASIAMESLDANYRAWKSVKKRNEGGPPFRDVLDSLFKEFGLEGEDFSFIQFRNAVVHEGLVEGLVGPQSNFIKEYYKLINQIDRIILRILNYNSYYLDIRNNFKRVLLKT